MGTPRISHTQLTHPHNHSTSQLPTPTILFQNTTFHYSNNRIVTFNHILVHKIHPYMAPNNHMGVPSHSSMPNMHNPALSGNTHSMNYMNPYMQQQTSTHFSHTVYNYYYHQMNPYHSMPQMMPQQTNPRQAQYSMTQQQSNAQQHNEYMMLQQRLQQQEQQRRELANQRNEIMEVAKT